MTVIYNPALYIHCLISFLLLYWYTICYIESGVEMFETMEQVETFFENRKAFGIKPGLDRINQLLQMQRNPQNQIEAIHIAGTNGKGSTLHYLSRSEEHTSELQSRGHLVCRLLLEKKKKRKN